MNALNDLLTSESMLTDLLIRFAASNAAVALPLGLLAWWTQLRTNRPFLTHTLWLIVLLKLVTPPFVGLPVIAAPDPGPFAFGFAPIDPVAVETAAAAVPAWWTALPDWKTLAVTVWLVGSALALAWSLIHIVRFDRLLGQTSQPVAPEWQERAAAIAKGLGLRRTPEVLTTAASISPMVWWLGGAVRIYAPRAMFEQLEAEDLRSILTHELAHVRRRDHLVRWLECLVCITLWWNPIAWWARRNLRSCEEICCDALVLTKTGASSDSYAGALINAMELLAAPMIRPSGLASHVNGGFIERRIKMILSRKSLANTPPWLRGFVLAAAVVVLPLGLTVAQEDNGMERVEQWLESGVNSGFVTEEQAGIMLSALRVADKQRIALVQRNGEAADGSGPVPGEDVPIEVVRRQLVIKEAETAKAMVWAGAWFDQQVASGRITQSERDAIVGDMEAALESGVTEGPAYYKKQVAVGLISNETAQRRLRMIEEMEQAWNQSPENAEIQLQKQELEAGVSLRRVPVSRF